MDSAPIMNMPTSLAGTEILAASILDSKASGFASDAFGSMLADTILAFEAQEPQVTPLPSGDLKVDGWLDANLSDSLAENVPNIPVPEAAIIDKNNLELIQAQMMALQAMPVLQQPQTMPVQAIPALQQPQIMVLQAMPGLQETQQEPDITTCISNTELSPINAVSSLQATEMKPDSSVAETVQQKKENTDSEILLTKTLPEPAKQQLPENFKQSSPASLAPLKAEDSSRQTSNNQDVLSTRQPDSAQIKLASGDQSEIQQILQTEPLPQELSSVTKNSGNASQNVIRFAQPTDMMISAADTTGKEDLSSDSGRQGSQMMDKSMKSVSVNPEIASPEISAEKTKLFSLSTEQQQLNPHTTARSMSSDPLKTALATETIVPEQIGRQVSERLVTHEFKQGTDQISFKLSPENLGNIQLNMRMEDQRLKLEIVTENRGAREALLQQSDSLKETLSRQNIQMDSFTVTTSNSGNLPQQSGGEWHQASTEQNRNQQLQNKTRVANLGTDFESPVRYFAPQYQSTIDVRF